MSFIPIRRTVAWRPQATARHGFASLGSATAFVEAVTALLAVIALLSVSSPVMAAAPGSGATFDATAVNYEPGPTTRRGGFAMGVNQSLGFGVYTGYPLKVAALSDPTQKQSTGPALSTQFSLWVGGALRDYLVVGGGLSLSTAQGAQIGVDTSFLLHIEAYPLFQQGGVWRDLGLSFDGGLGVGAIMARDGLKPGEQVANGGGMSTIGLGAFWEPLRFSLFSFGPQVNYVYGFSQTMQVHQGTVGIRFVLYSNQPKQTAKQAALEPALIKF